MRLKWKPASNPPQNHWPMVVAVRITCTCGYGGIAVLSAARKNGEWIIADFEHSFEIVEFMEIPKPSNVKLN